MLVFLGEADTGVLDADPQLRAVVAFVLEHGAYGDGAALGELDGVADQVGEDLLQPLRVALQLDRGIPVDQADQFQLLLVGGRSQHGQGVLDQVAEIERRFSRTSLPASIFEKSRISLMIPSRLSADFWMVVR